MAEKKMSSDRSDRYAGKYVPEGSSSKKLRSSSGGRDMAQEDRRLRQLRADRVTRIKDIFAKIRGKSATSAKGKPDGKGSKPAGRYDGPFPEDVDLPEFPGFDPPPRILPSLMSGPGFARGAADAAAMGAYASDPSMGPDGLNMIKRPDDHDPSRPSLEGAGAYGQAAGIAARSPHGAGMVQPDALAQSAVQAAAPYIPDVLRMITAPGSISTGVGRPAVEAADRIGGAGYTNYMDVLAEMLRGSK